MTRTAALKNTIKISGVLGTSVTILTVVFTVSGFYYKTTSTDEAQSEEIKLVKKEVTDIKATVNNTEVFKGVSTAEYTALKEKVAGIEKTVDKIDSKLDRVLVQTK